MSHQNFLSDDEPALASIGQDLRILEKYIFEGVQLNGSQLLTLAEYRDRIDQLVGQLPLPSSPGAARKQAQSMASTTSRKSPGMEVNDQSANDLQKAIRECLGPDYS